MRKQLHEVQAIDNYLFGNTTTPGRLLFEVKMIVSPQLKANVACQRRAHQFIRSFGRKKQKASLEATFERLMCEPDFSFIVNSIFK